MSKLQTSLHVRIPVSDDVQDVEKRWQHVRESIMEVFGVSGNDLTAYIKMKTEDDSRVRVVHKDIQGKVWNGSEEQLMSFQREMFTPVEQNEELKKIQSQSRINRILGEKNANKN